jgi:S1-C subfamily serine protease
VLETLNRPTRLPVLTVALALGAAPALAQVAPPGSAGRVYLRNSPAIVTISTSNGFGSGVLIHPAGVIVTNLHVVKGSSRATVKLATGDTYEEVAVVDFDARKDLVLLKVKAFDLPSAELGDSDALAVGDAVFGIGAPQGLELTLSEGIVSGLRDSGDGYKLVQTTAAMSQGSSGGGLFDANGRLVGVTSFRMSGGEGLNFAIPINYAKGMLATTATIDLAELKARTEEADDPPPQRAAEEAEAPEPETPVPVLAHAYISAQGKVAVVEQNGVHVTVRFGNPDGVIYGRSSLTWSPQNGGFVGLGALSTVCGSYDRRVWSAPIRDEIYLSGEGVIRERWTHPERVNCARGQVVESSWREVLWFVPSATAPLPQPAASQR